MENFYEDRHQHYFDSTVDIDPSVFLEPLASRLKPQATILDIGCGSGRDLLWFARRGFRPTGFEQAPSLAELARKHSNCSVMEGDFSRFDFAELHFDALVLVGSLVHIFPEELPAILTRTCQALNSGGLLLITLKEGRGSSHAADGRVFTLWSTEDIENVFAACNLHILDFSRQISKVRHDDIWLGYVLRYQIEA